MNTIETTPTNLFGFDYQTKNLTNLDGTPSKHSVVYGQNGQVVHTKKNSYTLIETQDLSTLGDAFIEQGYSVKPFIFNSGASIGLNVEMGQELKNVGDVKYASIITVPNDGGGKGYLSFFEKRLICSNGAIRKTDISNNLVKIPHLADYSTYLEIVKKAVIEYNSMLSHFNEVDSILDNQVLTQKEAMNILYNWFYRFEVADSFKELLTFKKFEEVIYHDFKEEFSFVSRFAQLKKAFNKELEYNSQLNLNLSKYTVFATITNYLTRRIEKSQSKAPVEVQNTRQAFKVDGILQALLQD